MMFRDALSFYNSASILKENPSDMSNRPYYVLLAFSIELFIKSINVKHTFHVNEKKQFKINHHQVKHTQGHKTDALFEKLTGSNIQLAEFLSSKYEERHKRSLVDDLKVNRDVFEGLRYTYPKDGNLVNNGKGVNKINSYFMPDVLEKVGEFIYEQTELLLIGQGKLDAKYSKLE